MRKTRHYPFYRIIALTATNHFKQDQDIVITNLIFMIAALKKTYQTKLNLIETENKKEYQKHKLDTQLERFNQKIKTLEKELLQFKFTPTSCPPQLFEKFEKKLVEIGKEFGFSRSDIRLIFADILRTKGKADFKYNFTAPNNAYSFQISSLTGASSLQRNHPDPPNYFDRKFTINKTQIGTRLKTPITCQWHTAAMTTAFNINSTSVRGLFTKKEIKQYPKAYQKDLINRINTLQTLLENAKKTLDKLGIKPKQENVKRDDLFDKINHLQSLHDTLIKVVKNPKKGGKGSYPNGFKSKYLAPYMRGVITLNRILQIIEKRFDDTATTDNNTLEKPPLLFMRIVSADVLRKWTNTKDINGNDELQMMIEEKSWIDAYNQCATPKKVLYFNFGINKAMWLGATNSQKATNAETLGKDEFRSIYVTALKHQKPKTGESSITFLLAKYIHKTLLKYWDKNALTLPDPLLQPKLMLIFSWLSGNKIVFGCKSAKDRTGHLWLDTLILMLKITDLMVEFKDHTDVKLTPEITKKFDALFLSQNSFTSQDAIKIFQFLYESGVIAHTQWAQGLPGLKSGNVLFKSWQAIAKADQLKVKIPTLKSFTSMNANRGSNKTKFGITSTGSRAMLSQLGNYHRKFEHVSFGRLAIMRIYLQHNSPQSLEYIFKETLESDDNGMKNSLTKMLQDLKTLKGDLTNPKTYESFVKKHRMTVKWINYTSFYKPIWKNMGAL